MARCGCAGTTCNCVVTAGENVTVTGTGSAGNPFVVSANASTVDTVDSPSIDFTTTPGDPTLITGIVRIDPVAGNLISLEAGGLRVDCDAIAACALNPAVDDTDTVNMTLAGNTITSDVLIDGTTPGNLIEVIPGGAPGGLRVDCDSVRTCFQNGPGIDGDDLALGIISVCLSTDPGNTLAFGADGCLFVAGGADANFPTVADTNTVNMEITPGGEITSDVIVDPVVGNLLAAGPAGLSAVIDTDCGLLGDGTVANPLRANVEPAFPFACGVANGGDIYCDPATGQLKSDPPHFALDAQGVTVGGQAGTPVTALSPAGAPPTVIGIPLVVNIVNPSPCRSMTGYIEYGILHLFAGNPPGGGAGTNDFEVNARMSIAGAAVGNQGPTLGGHQHWRASGQVGADRFTFDTVKAFSGNGAGSAFVPVTIAPGGVMTITLDATWETLASTTAPPMNIDGRRFGFEFHGHTV